MYILNNIGIDILLSENKIILVSYLSFKLPPRQVSIKLFIKNLSFVEKTNILMDRKLNSRATKGGDIKAN